MTTSALPLRSLPGLASGETVIITSTVTRDAFSVYRSSIWTVSLTVGDISGYEDVYFTAKQNLADPDSDAFLQVSETGGQLVWLKNPGVSANASISVTDAATGAIILTVEATDTQSATPVNTRIAYDVKAIISGNPIEMQVGSMIVLPVPTRAIS